MQQCWTAQLDHVFPEQIHFLHCCLVVSPVVATMLSVSTQIDWQLAQMFCILFLFPITVCDVDWETPLLASSNQGIQAAVWIKRGSLYDCMYSMFVALQQTAATL